MRKLPTLAVVLVALAGAHAAPVPRITPAPGIEGKYTLVSVSNQTGAVNAKGLPRPVSSTALLGPAVITNKEIVIEGRATAAALAAFGPGGSLTMEYTLDSSKTPMTIDIDKVDVRGNKAKSLGLVEVNGNRLILAVAKEGDERPKTTDEAAGVTVYYFQKAPPPPRAEYRIVAMTVGKEDEAEKELNRLAAAGYELVNTTHPAAVNEKAAPTTVHFILKRTVKQP